MKTELILKLQSDIDEQVTLASQQVDKFAQDPSTKNLHAFWRGKEQAWITARNMTSKAFRKLAFEMLDDD